jgi:hypothetical protein
MAGRNAPSLAFLTAVYGASFLDPLPVAEGRVLLATIALFSIIRGNGVPISTDAHPLTEALA